MSRRAKIVATLGPATSGPGPVAALVAAGLDVARLNMSHGDYDAHRAAYDAVRAVGDASGLSVGLLVDLQGPKIRLGRFAAGAVTLAPGQEFTITGEDVRGTSTRCRSATRAWLVTYSRVRDCWWTMAG
jgi:pyruvate kinase